MFCGMFAVPNLKAQYAGTVVFLNADSCFKLCSNMLKCCYGNCNKLSQNR